ncbi:MAG: formyl transferase [Zymomonas mobilis]
MSYPYVFEDNNEIYMLPEASRNGKLTLYRAVSFPDQWEKISDIDLGGDVAIDATPVFYNGLWLLFYMSANGKSQKKQELHAAYADQITGKWTLYKNNPVIEGAGHSRPGGTPVIVPNGLTLPVQDCTSTYGLAIRPLLFDNLNPDLITCSVGEQIEIPPSLAPYVEGMHTLSAVGDMTIIDAKKTDLSVKGVWLQIIREFKK